MLFHPYAVSVHHRTPIVVSAKLVYSRHQHFIVTFRHTLGFHSPRFSGTGIHPFLIMCNYPVGTNHSVIVLLFTQHFLDELLAEATSYPFRFDSYASRIVGHQSSGHLGLAFQFESTFRKGQRVQFKVTIGEYSILSKSLMTIPATFVACPSARPVLHHRVHTVPPPSVTNFRITF